MSPGVKVGSRGLFASCVAQHVTDQFGRHVPFDPLHCGTCVCCDFALPAFMLSCPATPHHRDEDVTIVLRPARRPRVGAPSRSSAGCRAGDRHAPLRPARRFLRRARRQSAFDHPAVRFHEKSVSPAVGPSSFVEAHRAFARHLCMRVQSTTRGTKPPGGFDYPGIASPDTICTKRAGAKKRTGRP